jgi:hypothetical protein
MKELLIGISSTVIGGFILWYFTERGNVTNNRNSIRNQGSTTLGVEKPQIIIVKRPIKVKVKIRNEKNAQNSNSDEDARLQGLIWLIAIVVIATSVAAFYVRYLPYIRLATFWSASLMIALEVLLLILSTNYYRRYADASALLATLPILATCVTFVLVLRTIDNPLFSPSGLAQTSAQLSSIEFFTGEWVTDLLRIYFDNPDAVTFLFMQAFGLVPLFLAVISNVYVQGKALFALYQQRPVRFARMTLWRPFWLTILALLPIGLFQIWVEYLQRVQ